MRKVVQLLHAPALNSDRWSTLYALCDDGTIWHMDAEKRGREWLQEQAIPQEIDEPVEGDVDVG